MHCTYAFATSKRLSNYLVLGGLKLLSLNLQCHIDRLQRSGVWMWVDVTSPQASVFCRTQKSVCFGGDMSGMRMENKSVARCRSTDKHTHTHTHKPIGVALLEFPHLLWLMYNDTTPHKSASSSIHWGRFFLPSSPFSLSSSPLPLLL